MPDQQPTRKPFHCRHILTDGHQCGSPALRGEQLCYYHHAGRRPAQHRRIDGFLLVALPEPTDLHAVQRGLCEVLRLAASGGISCQESAILLRGLAIASANLARLDRQTAAALKANPNRRPVDDYVIDPTLGTLAPAPEDQPAPTPRPEGPLPDPATLFTPPPIVELVQTPEQQRYTAALYEQAEHDLKNNAEERAAKRAASPLPPSIVALLPQIDFDPAPTSLQVQTYPSSNEYFGLDEPFAEQDLPTPEHSFEQPHPAAWNTSPAPHLAEQLTPC